MASGGLGAKVKALFSSSELQDNAVQNSPSLPTPVSLADVKKIEYEIIRYLLPRGCLLTEGSSSREELLCLATAAQRTNARLVGEIGFNVGISSYAFLAAGHQTQVVSFDLGDHRGTKFAKQLIDKRFPGRHTLIYGDSTKAVPEYTSQNPDLRFDLVFIDGGHEYSVAKADITNMKSLCTEKTVVVMDDLTPWHKWGEGPAQAWTEAIQDGHIQQDELFIDGKAVDALKPPGKRSWALGRYVFSNSSD
jgi:predicted O-methyltransferase YrrM